MTGSDQYSRLGADPGVFQDLLGRVPGKILGGPPSISSQQTFWSTTTFFR
jgi:hypothetical protein